MKLKQKKAISLIVLVITMIVMIILATAIILALNGNNIIWKAQEAKTSTDEASIKEAASVLYAEYDLKSKMGNLDSNEITADEYVKDSLKGQGFPEDLMEKLSVLNDGTIQMLPKIPKGFVTSIYEGEQKISNGLVIYETDSLENIEHKDAMKTYNQFVWVPVDDINNFTRIEVKRTTSPYFVYIQDTEEPSTKYFYTNESEEYAAMYESVAKYGGFYIARYEAGDGDVKSPRTAKTTAHKVVSKKEAYVYNYVPFSVNSYSGNEITGEGAAYYSRNMELSNKEEVVTTLVYGVQWDSILQFISDEVDITDSGRSWGNTNNSIGEAAVNSGRSSMYYTTGKNEAWKAKNIYDFAGNVCEWTMEGKKNSNYRVVRGGSYFDFAWLERLAGSYFDLDAYTGFRVALYLK